MTDIQPSGIDMARAAVAAARAAAKTRPAQPQKKARGQRVARTGGRDPIGLGAAIGGMMTERGWEPPEAGGSVLDQWPTVAPELVGKVAAVRFEHDTGTLHLCPISDAYATQLRLFRAQIIRRIREKTGHGAVRAIQILPPGASSPPAAVMDDAPASPQPQTAGQPRHAAPEGYLEARDLLLAHRPDGNPTDPHLVFAVARQDRAIRNPANREPASQFTDGIAEAERGTEPVLDRSEQVRRAALARKHAEAAGRIGPRRVFDVA